MAMASLMSMLQQPIALRPEFVSTAPTTLQIKQHDDGWFGGDFTVNEVSCPSDSAPQFQESTHLFSVDGKVLSQKRIFRDVFGLPLFELKRHHKVGASWTVSLPGENSRPIVTLAPRFSVLKDKVDVYVINAANRGEKVTLEVRGQDIFKQNTKVYHSGELVMEANMIDKSALWVPGRRPEWHVAVAQGMDPSLASIIIVMLATTMYNSSMTASAISSTSGPGVAQAVGF